MELSGRTLTDPQRRGSVTFAVTAADSAGRLLSTISVLRPGFPPVPLHVHPHQHERFVVHRGRLRVTAGRRRRVLGPGQELVVAPGTPHTFAVAGAEEVEVQVDFSPAGDMEGFLAGLWALTLRRPALREVAALGRAHFADFRLARVPVAAQRTLLALLGRGAPPPPAPGFGQPHAKARGSRGAKAGLPPGPHRAPVRRSPHDLHPPATRSPGLLRRVRRPRGRVLALLAPPPRRRLAPPPAAAPAPAPPRVSA